jgi:hypothetical protein
MFQGSKSTVSNADKLNKMREGKGHNGVGDISMKGFDRLWGWRPACHGLERVVSKEAGTASAPGQNHPSPGLSSTTSGWLLSRGLDTQGPSKKKCHTYS